MTPEQKAKEYATSVDYVENSDNQIAAHEVIDDREYKAFLAGYQYAQEWVSEKPVFTDAAVFVSASSYKDEWSYTLWIMIWTDGYNEKEEHCRYLALCNQDGEEWGDYADLSAHKYLILTPPNKEISHANI